MTTTTISDLPEDLLREIVCRVPITSMRAVRFTCKKWDSLTKIQMCVEAARAEGESQIVAIRDFNLHLISVVVADVDNPSTESKGKLSRLSLDDSDQQQEVKIIKVFHCDGLLLCVLKDSFKLVVWNPYLGQTRWIEPPTYGIDRYMYALGYDNKKKSHKILRFVDGVCYKIYDLDSNVWRTLDVGTQHWYIDFYCTGVPLNGNTYWLAQHRNSDYEVSTGFIVCFDFTSERFGPILPLPIPSEEDHEIKGLLSSLRGEKLSLMLHFESPTELEAWVLTDPNNVSWSKLFKVDTGPAPEIYFSNSGFFIDEEKKVAMVFDIKHDTRFTLSIIGEDGFFRQVDVDPLSVRSVPARVCSYVPILVQVQIKKRASEREQPSKLEIRPSQQNKPRLDDHEEEEDDHSAKRTRRA